MIDRKRNEPALNWSQADHLHSQLARTMVGWKRERMCFLEIFFRCEKRN